MMSNKGKRPLRHLTASDKIVAIQRIHDGESKASVARDIGVPESTLRGWCKNEEKLRYMSRQSSGAGSSDSIKMEKLSDDASISATATSLFGPPEKRSKHDTSMPSMSGYAMGKHTKYSDELYKGRNSMGALDFSSTDNKAALNALNYSGLAAEYTAAYKQVSQNILNANSKAKENQVKTDSDNNIKTELSMNAISPLTSLSHLTGMPSLAQSMNFDLASSLSMLYSNPAGLSAMAGLANFGHTASAGGSNGVQPQQSGNTNNNISSSSRNSRQKSSQASPRSEMDKATTLTVKNLEKLQRKSNSASDLDVKKPLTAASTNREPAVEDNLLYWLRSQQAMLGLNNLYSAATAAAASPNRSSPQQLQQQLQQLQQHASFLQAAHSTPPNNGNLTPLNGHTTPVNQRTPTSQHNEDAKQNNFWANMYNTFGIPNDKQNALNNNNITITTAPNILYSQLTKAPRKSSPAYSNDLLTVGMHYISPDTLNNNINEPSHNKPEDLSAAGSSAATRPTAASSSSGPNSPRKRHRTPSPNTSSKQHASAPASPAPGASNAPRTPSNSSPPKSPTSDLKAATGKFSQVRSVLDNLLFTHAQKNQESRRPSISNPGSPVAEDSADSLDSDASSSSPCVAVEHGEKFLLWLESCSDPSITAMQVTQFRTLLNSIKNSADRAAANAAAAAAAAAVAADASSSATEERPLNRRRK